MKNMEKNVVVMLLAFCLLFALFIFFMIQLFPEKGEATGVKECVKDEECIFDFCSCQCLPKDKINKSSEIVCSSECILGHKVTNKTICECIDGFCEAVGK